MSDQFSRIRMVCGEAAVERLFDARVAVFGIGGVGGFAAEALVRSGLGAIDLIDDDKVSRTNLNRHIIATRRTIGHDKVAVMRERLLDINPACRVEVHKIRYLPDTAAQFDLAPYDYVIDALDTLTAKIALIEGAKAVGTPIISAMGAGNKIDPTALRIADISDTRTCPLARVMRRELKRRGIYHVKVAFSLETPKHAFKDDETTLHDRDCRASKKDLRLDREGRLGKPGVHELPLSSTDTKHMGYTADPDSDFCRDASGVPRRAQIGSTAFVPAAMGLALAAEVAKDLMGGVFARVK